MMDMLQGPPVNARDIQRRTDQDPLLWQVRNLILQGSRLLEEEEMQPFNNRRDELSMQDGFVLWGSRVVVPKVGREKVLEVLHKGHP